jgi:hypothetical protein
MCSEWHTFGVSAIAAITSSVKSFGCGLVNRTRSSPSTPPHAAATCRTPAGRRTHAVRVDVLPEQGHLEHALGDQRLDLGQDLAGRRSFSLPRSDGTMQKVQVLLQPTEMETQPE